MKNIFIDDKFLVALNFAGFVVSAITANKAGHGVDAVEKFASVSVLGFGFIWQACQFLENLLTRRSGADCEADSAEVSKA
jgi:hypothetical protein